VLGLLLLSSKLCDDSLFSGGAIGDLLYGVVINLSPRGHSLASGIIVSKDVLRYSWALKRGFLAQLARALP
jgi:hypothetical protein